MFMPLTTRLQQRLSKQLEDLNVPFTNDFPTALSSTDHVVDAIFGEDSIDTDSIHYRKR